MLNYDEHNYDEHSHDEHGFDGHSFDDHTYHHDFLGYGSELDGKGLADKGLADKGLAGKGLKGYLLAISPFFEDDLFDQAVILIVQHDEAGAVGLVLNQPADAEVLHLWKDVCETSASPSIRFGIGGPLSGPVVALHTSKVMGEQMLGKGLFLSAHANRLKQLSGQSRIPCRLVIGHSEWEPGALEEEVENGLWMPVAATAGNVFGDDEYLWQKVIQAVGDEVILSAPGVHKICDPLLN
jgi:putative transcriptional regulator